MPRTEATSDGLLSGSPGRDVAEKGLREAITRGTIAPGHRLVEAELSEQYGVTRNSARLALDALAAEGLVERIPNRGARVRTVSTAEAVEIMECRMVLDGLLSAKAAELADDDQVARLLGNRELMRRAVAERELLRYSELIQNHHALVREAARHPIASELVQRLAAQIVRHQFQLSLRPGRAEQSLAELERVVDAIVARDPAAADAAAREHLGGVIAAVREEALV
ncbi:GntR family transcriptional regulator [Actinomycetospora sp. TBRC 11914]|uniref:GntR family transcriptional regulator n=1 Tax=Actinomycetospora sp. TBRC 11914 TaxID=2729387 RepID=UPI0028A15155|nr:GntR family transcriptional regulator [Actinomycetospora sp. TBRC 11914]